MKRMAKSRMKIQIIRAKIDSHQLRKVLHDALQRGATHFTFWFYPETSEDEKKRLLAAFQAFSKERKRVEPITVYGKENLPVELSPILFDLSPLTIDKVAIHFEEVEDICDSVATYKDGTFSFISAAIFHEREIILQN